MTKFLFLLFTEHFEIKARYQLNMISTDKQFLEI